jgi:hypothetical protein
VIQGSRVLRLPAEAHLERCIPGQIGTEHLDRDISAKAKVTAVVHLGHAAISEQLADLIPAPEQAARTHLVIPLVNVITSPFRHSP